MFSVYQYFATKGQLLYVGVTSRGTRRMHEHADSKEWWAYTRGCTIEHYTTREEALEREAHLIEVYRPPFNQQHNPDCDIPIPDRVEAIPKMKKMRHRAIKSIQKKGAVAPCIECGIHPLWEGSSNGLLCFSCNEQKEN